MEPAHEAPPKTQLPTPNSDSKTPQQNQETVQNTPDSGNDLRKTCTPDRLKVPKAFKYPERYRSPTDSMISPITKGLLARNRRAGATATALLPPTLNHTQIHDLRVQDVGIGLLQD